MGKTSPTSPFVIAGRTMSERSEKFGGEWGGRPGSWFEERMASFTMLKD